MGNPTSSDVFVSILEAIPRKGSIIEEKFAAITTMTISAADAITSFL